MGTYSEGSSTEQLHFQGELVLLKPSNVPRFQAHGAHSMVLTVGLTVMGPQVETQA